ncbi:hypothetical protein H696_03075 [Fonticula alba]|uniref:Uncharacterized protein n=1 Tax=Fonticula alba TaxID=691883 RepID=A0A058Z8T8_FONAL|nr:hypothetical protein H696_03075 [Fonticula alba]KCV70724.1 hypothetical protein H696_03075 [Fonticula alba]|eukprot:XP_009495240.1 hypothetical protein H696_03075 [Fonticula alba]
MSGPLCSSSSRPAYQSFAQGAAAATAESSLLALQAQQHPASKDVSRPTLIGGDPRPAAPIFESGPVASVSARPIAADLAVESFAERLNLGEANSQAHSAPAELLTSKTAPELLGPVDPRYQIPPQHLAALVPGPHHASQLPLAIGSSVPPELLQTHLRMLQAHQAQEAAMARYLEVPANPADITTLLHGPDSEVMDEDDFDPRVFDAELDGAFHMINNAHLGEDSDSQSVTDWDAFGEDLDPEIYGQMFSMDGLAALAGGRPLESLQPTAPTLDSTSIFSEPPNSYLFDSRNPFLEEGAHQAETARGAYQRALQLKREGNLSDATLAFEAAVSLLRREMEQTNDHSASSTIRLAWYWTSLGICHADNEKDQPSRSALEIASTFVCQSPLVNSVPEQSSIPIGWALAGLPLIISYVNSDSFDLAYMASTKWATARYGINLQKDNSAASDSPLPTLPPGLIASKEVLQNLGRVISGVAGLMDDASPDLSKQYLQRLVTPEDMGDLEEHWSSSADSSIVEAMAALCHLIGDFSSAVTYFTRAIELSPTKVRNLCLSVCLSLFLSCSSSFANTY